MLITVIYENTSLPVVVDKDDDLERLKTAIETAFGIATPEQKLFINDSPITVSEETPISVLQLSDEDVVILKKVGQDRKIHLADVPSNTSPEGWIRLVNEHPNIRIQLSNADPELYFIVNSGDVTGIRTLLMRRIMSGHKVIFEKKLKEQSVWANPDDPENQAYIQEQVRLQNVQVNMETAMEELPEGFGRVCMLYVDVEINGHPVKAFVDSGAQSTIMSIQCAERCGLMRLLDTRFAGVAQGVGTAKILGKVHMSQMKFGNSYFPVSITVLDQDRVDFLFGLDMLMRHRCEISLRHNELRIDSVDGIECVKFLSEHDIPSEIVVEQTERSDSMSESPLQKGVCIINQDKNDEEYKENACDCVDAGKIEHLMSLGFGEVQSRNALMQTNGDADMAASLLMSNLD